MQVTMAEDGTIALAGRLDGRSAADVRETLHAQLAAGRARLVVDLAGVELIDATGLGVLVGAHRRARLSGIELVLRDATPRVARLLALTRVDRVIPHERTGVPA
jgi:anti-sigma B factor antagonist